MQLTGVESRIFPLGGLPAVRVAWNTLDMNPSPLRTVSRSNAERWALSLLLP